MNNNNYAQKQDKEKKQLVFDNIKIEFTILKENPLTTGCKVTGRLNLGVLKIL